MKKATKNVVIALLAVAPWLISGQEVLAEEGNSTYIPRPARPSDLIDRAQEVVEESQEESLEASIEEMTETEEVSEETTEKTTIEETTRREESQESETSQEETTVKEEKTLEEYIEDPLRVYTYYQFDKEQDADSFIENFVDDLEEDPYSQNQFEYFKTQAMEDMYECRFAYAKTSSDKQRPLFVYAEGRYKDEEEANAFIDQQMNLFPDIFQGGDVVEEDGGVYNVALAIKVGADAQEVVHNPVTKLMEYNGERQPYTYKLAKGEEDTIQATITELFPDTYEFSEEETEDGIAVTMTPVATNQVSPGRSPNGEELTGWRRTLNDFVSPYGFRYQQVIAALAIVIAILGLILIILK